MIVILNPLFFQLLDDTSLSDPCTVPDLYMIKIQNDMIDCTSFGTGTLYDVLIQFYCTGTYDSTAEMSLFYLSYISFQITTKRTRDKQIEHDLN